MMKKLIALFLLMAVVCMAFGRTLNCNRAHEEYQCGSACQTTCKNLGKPCPIVNIRCNDACYCIDGYARNDVGRCIPIAKCPKQAIKSQ